MSELQTVTVTGTLVIYQHPLEPGRRVANYRFVAAPGFRGPMIEVVPYSTYGRFLFGVDPVVIEGNHFIASHPDGVSYDALSCSGA